MTGLIQIAQHSFIGTSPYLTGIPSAIESYPIGHCIVDKHGVNITSFHDNPGAKFTHDRASLEKLLTQKQQ